jgi:hypothetical protein
MSCGFPSGFLASGLRAGVPATQSRTGRRRLPLVCCLLALSQSAGYESLAWFNSKSCRLRSFQGQNSHRVPNFCPEASRWPSALPRTLSEPRCQSPSTPHRRCGPWPHSREWQPHREAARTAACQETENLVYFIAHRASLTVVELGGWRVCGRFCAIPFAQAVFAPAELTQ